MVLTGKLAEAVTLLYYVQEVPCVRVRYRLFTDKCGVSKSLWSM